MADQGLSQFMEPAQQVPIMQPMMQPVQMQQVAKPGMLGSMKGVVSRNPMLAIGLIVVLVLILAYQFLRSKGYLGGAKQAAENVDSEVTNLIDSINSTQ
jgi:hypothetical protein